MRTANDKLKKSVVAVIKWQLILLLCSTILFAICFKFTQSEFFGLPLWSFLYGAMLAILSTIISAVSARRAGDAAYNRSPAAMAAIYLGALNKLILVAAGVTIAFVKLSLSPLWLLGGFLLMHVAQIAVGVKQKTF